MSHVPWGIIWPAGPFVMGKGSSLILRVLAEFAELAVREEKA